MFNKTHELSMAMFDSYVKLLEAMDDWMVDSFSMRLSHDVESDTI